MSIASSRCPHDLSIACGANAERKRMNTRSSLLALVEMFVCSSGLLRRYKAVNKYDATGTYNMFWQWMQEKNPLAVLLRCR
jgi:hypothetical protein